MNKTELAITQGITRLASLAWLLYLFLAQPHGAMNAVVITTVILAMILGIVFIVAEFRNRFVSPLGIYVDLIYYLTIFIVAFAATYWNYGTLKNFNVPLSHLDALYFTIGTFSTAGTGNIVATSDLARALQSLQMLLDLAFVLVAITLVVMRLGSVKRES